MIRSLVLALVFGLGGTAILVMLSVWQVQRLDWKEARIAEIEARLGDTPTALPAAPDPDADRFKPIVEEGRITAEAVHVLTSTSAGGPGFEVIAAFETADGRRVLVDRGFLPEARKDATLYTGPLTVEGNLDWPQESDTFTPDPNLERNIWFARDVGAVAAHLGTEPVMIVARTLTGDPGPRPQPVTVNLANNHLQYAITWALIAVVWLAMTVLLVLRIRSRPA